MATATVTSTVRDPGGNPVTDVVVTASLYPAGITAYDPSGGEITPVSVPVRTDQTGTWSLALERTDTMVPANMAWQIDEASDSQRWRKTTYIVVGAGGGRLENLLVQPPAAPPQAVVAGNADLSAYEQKANKGVASGYAGLDANAKVPTTNLPALAITDTYVVASQAAMLALAAQQGDIAIRTDLSQSFILTTADPTLLANWQLLESPPNAVTSVDGRTGVVTLSDRYDAAGAAGTAQAASLQKSANLSDVAAPATARTNLGLDTAATQPSTAFDAAGAAASAQAASLQKASNLSDVVSAATARTNLGLGTAATENVGTAGDVTTSAFGDAAALGATARLADAGHRHGREANPLPAPGTSGNVLTSTGTAWSSSPAAGGALPKHYAQVHRAAALTASASYNDFVFDAKDHDPDNAYNTATGEYTAPVAGQYSITAMLAWNGVTAGSTNLCEVYVKPSGGAYGAVTRLWYFSASPGGTVELSGSTELTLGAGDMVKLRYFLTAGPSAGSSSADACRASFRYLGAT